MTPITHQPVQPVLAPPVDDAPGHIRAHLPNITLAALRIVAGFMFMQHGAQKMFGWLLTPDMPPFTGAPDFLSKMWIAGVLELGGGLLLALGLFTRPVAFLIAGEMAVAYFTVHLPQGFWPIQNGGELAALYCFVFLVFVAVGGTRYSLDHLYDARGRDTTARRSQPADAIPLGGPRTEEPIDTQK